MTKMTENRLRDIIAAYGHQPQHWPADERRDAEALLAARPAALRDALDEAAALDAQLDQLPAVDLPDGLISKVLDAAPVSQAGAGAPNRAASLWPFPGFRTWAASAAAACLAVGVAAGYSMPLQDAGTYDTSDEALIYALLDNTQLSSLGDSGE